MGRYLNPSSDNFQRGLNSEIYVDKSELISFTNKKINTQQGFLCVSRPRRFGKSMAADMLGAYYGCGENTEPLFAPLKIHSDASFTKHLNQYYVIKIDMQSFMTSTSSVVEMLEMLKRSIRKDFRKEFSNIDWSEQDALWENIYDIYTETGRKFVILIDEWDCVMRRYHTLEHQKNYLDFLRNLMKDQPYIALAYMTGILPIKKYGEHSTLNMFYEYSMIRSYPIVPYFGFTEEEVKTLCSQYDMNFEEAKNWYDGYKFVNGVGDNKICYSIYSPKSVVDAMLNHCYDTYWTQTETYEALKEYIQKNYEGLKDAIVEMLAGSTVSVNTRHFQNDMNTFNGKDDILTLLIHLGYLSYNQEDRTVSIPNKEVAEEFINSIENINSYSEVFQSVKRSKELLNALWNEDAETVANYVEKTHQHFPSIHYNNENALSCVIELAFYYAHEYYTTIRELPTGKGFADICFVPKSNHTDKPAIIIELKWDKTAQTAIDQIKRRDYPDALKAYHGNLLLCGISYSREKKSENKRHQCVIERLSL